MPLEMAPSLVVVLMSSIMLLVVTNAEMDRQVLDPGSNAQQNEKEIIVHLEDAHIYLQKALAAESDCRAQITSALALMSKMEVHLLQDDYTGAMAKLSQVKQLLHECNESLKISNGHLSKALLYLTMAASDRIDQATMVLAELISRKPTSSRGPYNPPVVVTDIGSNGACKVDGTICQFSACGRGHNLPACAVGFAAGVTGGANGQFYVVTSPEDNPESPKPGTLRHAVAQGGLDTPVWITFAQNMTILLHEMLWLRSATTVDGRGVNVTITGRNLVLGGVTNVILHNLQISSVGETDTIHIFSGSKQVWVDHISSWDARLGLVSVLQGSTDVTISNSLLTNPNFNMLLGASDADAEDKLMRVTIYRNWFKDSTQRMPHCRWGFCHVVNNLYTDWGYYAIGGRVNAKVLSESNVFVAGRRTEVTPWYPGNGIDFDTTATIQSSNDLFLNGTTFHQFQGSPEAMTLATTSQYTTPNGNPPIHPTSTLYSYLQKCSGVLFGTKLEECALAM